MRALRGGPGDRKKRRDSRDVLEAKIIEVDTALVSGNEEQRESN